MLREEDRFVRSEQIDQGEGIQRRGSGLASTSHSVCFLEEEKKKKHKQLKSILSGLILDFVTSFQ